MQTTIVKTFVTRRNGRVRRGNSIDLSRCNERFAVGSALSLEPVSCVSPASVREISRLVDKLSDRQGPAYLDACGCNLRSLAAIVATQFLQDFSKIPLCHSDNSVCDGQSFVDSNDYGEDCFSICEGSLVIEDLREMLGLRRLSRKKTFVGLMIRRPNALWKPLSVVYPWGLLSSTGVVCSLSDLLNRIGADAPSPWASEVFLEFRKSDVRYDVDFDDGRDSPCGSFFVGDYHRGRALDQFVADVGLSVVGSAQFDSAAGGGYSVVQAFDAFSPIKIGLNQLGAYSAVPWLRLRDRTRDRCVDVMPSVTICRAVDSSPCCDWMESGDSFFVYNDFGRGKKESWYKLLPLQAGRPLAPLIGRGVDGLNPFAISALVGWFVSEPGLRILMSSYSVEGDGPVIDTSCYDFDYSVRCGLQFDRYAYGSLSVVSRHVAHADPKKRATNLSPPSDQYSCVQFNGCRFLARGARGGISAKYGWCRHVEVCHRCSVLKSLLAPHDEKYQEFCSFVGSSTSIEILVLVGVSWFLIAGCDKRWIYHGHGRSESTISPLDASEVVPCREAPAYEEFVLPSYWSQEEIDTHLMMYNSFRQAGLGSLEGDQCEQC